jgi:hypothetical protein
METQREPVKCVVISLLVDINIHNEEELVYRCELVLAMRKQLLHLHWQLLF